MNHKVLKKVYITETFSIDFHDKFIYFGLFCFFYFSSHTLYMYEVHTISFQTFFVWAFKIAVDSWKFTMLLLYVVWDDRPIFMISGSKEQLQQQLEYTLQKPDCHSWWISKTFSLIGMHSATASMCALTKLSYSSFGVSVFDISWGLSNFFLSYIHFNYIYCYAWTSHCVECWFICIAFLLVQMYLCPTIRWSCCILTLGWAVK